MLNQLGKRGEAPAPNLTMRAVQRLTRLTSVLNTQENKCVQGMRQEDLKEMANRCRRMAGTADEFTKKRLLDLALKYEARSEGKLPPKRLFPILSDPNHP